MLKFQIEMNEVSDTEEQKYKLSQKNSMHQLFTIFFSIVVNTTYQDKKKRKKSKVLVNNKQQKSIKASSLVL